MSRNSIHLILGILLICMPFTGFPTGFKSAFYVFCGIVFIVIAWMVFFKRRLLRRNAEGFEENRRERTSV